MGHVMENRIYSATTKKEQIMAELREYVEMKCFEEGGSLDDIRFNDIILDDYNEAERWIKEHDRGDYDQLAVKFRKYNDTEAKAASSKRYRELQEKIKTRWKLFLPCFFIGKITRTKNPCYNQGNTGKGEYKMRKTKKVVEYDIKGCDDIKSIVIETKRQKDILEILDERLENVRDYGYEWKKIFEDETFRIEYNDGTMYQADELGEEGVYKKKGIKIIIYINPMDTQVFGDYEVNEYGNIS